MVFKQMEYKDARGFRPTLQSDMDAFGMKTHAPLNNQSQMTDKISDARYPALSAVMSDARQFTDYRAHCALNISPASQFKAKQWMVDNAAHIIELSRRRQAEKLGATAAVSQVTGPGAAAILTCTPDSCSILDRNARGIGILRANMWAEQDVPLFGTFMYAPVDAVAQFTAPLFTVKQEGGRNTSRG